MPRPAGLLCLFLITLFWAAPLLAAKKVTLEGEAVHLDKDSQTLIYKNPRMVFPGGEVSAQTLRFQKEKGLMDFKGNVVLRAKNFLITAVSAQYDLKKQRFEAHSVGLYDYVNQTYLSAKDLVQTGKNRFEIKEVTLTLCNPDDPAWEFYSTYVDYQIDNFAYSINTVLLFNQIPIFYLPVTAWPTRKGRSSGFLAPLYLSKRGAPTDSQNYGERIKIPYYWAISPEQDLTVEADLISRRGLASRFLYRWAFLPGMSGNFELWQISENNRRNLDQPTSNRENIGGLSANKINPKAKRYRYILNHKQNLAGGNFFFHQDQRSDNEVEKEYQSRRIGRQYSLYRTASWVYPWSGGGLTVGHEHSQRFLYPSVFDHSTDQKIHLNRDSYLEVNQQLNNLFGSKLSLSGKVNSFNYLRKFGWSGNLTEASVSAQAPFQLNFLNLLPTFQRTRYQYLTSYRSTKTETKDKLFVANPGSYGWNIDKQTVEANLEFFRIFGQGKGAKSRLGIRPRVIYAKVRDVDQRGGTNFKPGNTLTKPSGTTGPSADYRRFGNRFVRPTYGYETLTYRLETRYLTKRKANDNVRSALSFDVEQTYNLGRKSTLADTWKSYSGPQVPEGLQETSLGNQMMPLRLFLNLSPQPQYQVGMFYRYDHELGRMIENRASFKVHSPLGDQLRLAYGDNSKAYMDLKGNYHARVKNYSMNQTITLGGRNRLQFSARWDLSRNDPAALYSTGGQFKALDRQMTRSSVILTLGHQCFDYQIGFKEQIYTQQVGSVREERLGRRLTFSMRLAKWPSPHTPFQKWISLP